LQVLIRSFVLKNVQIFHNFCVLSFFLLGGLSLNKTAKQKLAGIKTVDLQPESIQQQCIINHCGMRVTRVINGAQF